jgi:hypothetical protein
VLWSCSFRELQCYVAAVLWSCSVSELQCYGVQLASEVFNPTESGIFCGNGKDVDTFLHHT